MNTSYPDRFQYNSRPTAFFALEAVDEADGILYYKKTGTEKLRHLGKLIDDLIHESAGNNSGQHPLDSQTVATFYDLIRGEARVTHTEELAAQMWLFSADLSSFDQLPRPRQKMLRDFCLALSTKVLDNYEASITPVPGAYMEWALA